MATLVIWFLQTFDLHLTQVTDSQNSILAHVAGVTAPIFKPMGFGDWRISTALITGFLAKESVVSTLSILFGGTEALMSLLTPLAVVSLLTFCRSTHPAWQLLPPLSGSWVENGLWQLWFSSA